MSHRSATTIIRAEQPEKRPVEPGRIKCNRTPSEESGRISAVRKSPPAPEPPLCDGGGGSPAHLHPRRAAQRRSYDVAGSLAVSAPETLGPPGPSSPPRQSSPRKQGTCLDERLASARERGSVSTNACHPRASGDRNCRKSVIPAKAGIFAGASGDSRLRGNDCHGGSLSLIP
jgi:hypothetical protein